MLNLIGGTLFHSEILPEAWVQRFFPVFAIVSGFGIQTIGMILLLVGAYRVIRSLQPQLDAHYLSLVENSIVGVYLVQDGVFKFVNPRMAELAGCEPSELVGKSVLDLIDPEDRALVKENIRRRIAGEIESVHYEFKGLRKDGEHIDLEAYGSRVTYQGKPAIHGMLLDVTHRKRSQKALRENEERYRAITENTYDLICETGVDRNFLYLSPNYKEVLGYDPEELIGRDIFELVHPEDRALVIAEFNQHMEMRTPGQMVFRYRHKNGEWHWFDSAGKTFMTAEGEVRAVIVSRDITERKMMEDELLKSKKLESIGILAGGIAHDFNNILTAIMGNIAIAKMDMNPEEENYSVLNEAEHACLQAKDLTQQLLTFSKGGAPIKKTTSITGFLKETIEFNFRGSNVKCEFHIDERLWPVDIDEGQMSQVINNLIINADHSMPNGGIIKAYAQNVEVDTKHGLPVKAGKYVKIAFEDQGVGIPKEHIPKIFDPYFTTKQKGSGLGLATCYSIIKNHGGAITVGSQFGIGSIFSIYLPASDQKTIALQQLPEADSEDLRTANGKVLIMDDEPAIRKSTERLLRHIGYEVELAQNGFEAIDLYKRARQDGHPFDAVILDLTIPGGMGGRETMQLLREVDPKVKGIVSSGYSNDPIMADYEKYGFQNFVAKPYRVDELRQKLQDVISNSGSVN
ncbi:MAG: PAS domain S-box protein [bacterium]